MSRASEGVTARGLALHTAVIVLQLGNQRGDSRSPAGLRDEFTCVFVSEKQWDGPLFRSRPPGRLDFKRWPAQYPTHFLRGSSHYLLNLAFYGNLPSMAIKIGNAYCRGAARGRCRNCRAARGGHRRKRCHQTQADQARAVTPTASSYERGIAVELAADHSPNRQLQFSFKLLF